MGSSSSSKGRIAVVGAGPGRNGDHARRPSQRVRRRSLRDDPEIRPAGNILNLWPPPHEGARAARRGHRRPRRPHRLASSATSAASVRVAVKLPRGRAASYGGGFIGLLRPELYERMLAAIPRGRDPVRPAGRAHRAGRPRRHAALRRRQHRRARRAGRRRRHRLPRAPHAVGRCAQARAPAAHLRRVHLRRGRPAPTRDMCILTHSRTMQGSWTSIRHKGRDGYQWWVLDAPPTPTPRRRLTCTAPRTELAAGFPAPLPGLIAATEPENVQRWVLRDRKPLKQWSQGPGHAGRRRRPPHLALRRLRRRHVDRGRLLPRPPAARVDLTDHAAVARRAAGLRGPAQAAHRPQVSRWPGCSARSSTTRRAAATGPRLRLRPHAVPAEGGRGGDTGPDHVPAGRDRQSGREARLQSLRVGQADRGTAGMTPQALRCPIDQDFEPLSPAFLSDPYAVMSDRPRVFYAPSIDYYVVTRYADIEAVFLHPRDFSAAARAAAARRARPRGAARSCSRAATGRSRRWSASTRPSTRACAARRRGRSRRGGSTRWSHGSARPSTSCSTRSTIRSAVRPRRRR